MTPRSGEAISGWDTALKRLAREHGVLELTLPGEPTAERPTRWRGRLLKVERAELVVEAPKPGEGPGGDAIAEARGPVGVVMHVDKRRWSLRCRVIDQVRFPLDRVQEVEAVRLSWPDQVEDAQRRRHFRATTGCSTIPSVDLWGVDDPADCVAYERHNRRRHLERWGSAPDEADAPPWPGVEPWWRGLVVDVSGGGLNVALPRAAEPLAEAHTLLWTKLPLPEMEEPLYAVARVVRHEPQTERVLRIGVAFTFEHHPSHERFVIDRLCRYASFLQRRQLQRRRGRNPLNGSG